MTRVLLLAALALACVASPALAAEVATVGDKAVILPWGDWLVALAVSLREPILTLLLPIVAAYVIQAIRKVYPMAVLFLTQRRVEMMLEAGVGPWPACSRAGSRPRTRGPTSPSGRARASARW
ncbi:MULTISPECIES: hypothetical protein [unclassified Methylobacterium]|uniref:hypothetical protein n=1 Tax=unclassified Methylobacterium TaxID=2615210 RepID=UPI0036F60014